MERLELARLLVAVPPAGPSASGPWVIEERDPVRFMRAFAEAAASERPIFLADPAWGPTEKAALAALIGTSRLLPPTSLHPQEGWLMIPSGGTSGRLKFARHDQDSIAAAVRGFAAHFRIGQANSVGVLPLHHVSGLMAWMRSALTGGSYLPWDWKRLDAGDFPILPGPGWFLSLVPTQLQRLVARPEAAAWLRGFEAIFVGGGPVWPDLADAAARAGLPVSLGYGMTETAAMATASRPADFLTGDRSSGSPLPHARIDLTEEGLIRIAGDSLFRGYFPAWRPPASHVTEDLGRFEADGRLHVLGRRDDLIITGGEKVDPREVEAALRASGEFEDVAVVGLPDRDWGRAVVACYPAGQASPNLERVAAHLSGLAGFKRPRRYLPVSDWPRNAQGKLNRGALAAHAAVNRP